MGVSFRCLLCDGRRAGGRWRRLRSWTEPRPLRLRTVCRAGRRFPPHSPTEETDPGFEQKNKQTIKTRGNQQTAVACAGLCDLLHSCLVEASYLMLTSVPLTFRTFIGRADPVPRNTTSGYFSAESVAKTLEITVWKNRQSAAINTRNIRRSDQNVLQLRLNKSPCTFPRSPGSLGLQRLLSRNPRGCRKGWRLCGNKTRDQKDAQTPLCVATIHSRPFPVTGQRSPTHRCHSFNGLSWNFSRLSARTTGTLRSVRDSWWRENTKTPHFRNSACGQRAGRIKTHSVVSSSGLISFS